MYSATVGCDPGLIGELERVLQARPEAAALWNALGYVRAMVHPQGRPHAAQASLPAFEKAWTCDSRHVVAGLNVAEALADLGHKDDAVQQARQTLEVLDGLPELDARVIEAAHYPPEFDLFHVEWERAGWQHAGQPGQEAQAKRDLLRWRLHLTSL
jgi:hypothetical protein